MRTSQSFGVHFTVKKDKVKDGIATIYAVITINKEKAILIKHLHIYILAHLHI